MQVNGPGAAPRASIHVHADNQQQDFDSTVTVAPAIMLSAWVHAVVRNLPTSSERSSVGRRPVNWASPQRARASRGLVEGDQARRRGVAPRLRRPGCRPAPTAVRRYRLRELWKSEGVRLVELRGFEPMAIAGEVRSRARPLAYPQEPHVSRRG